MAKGKGTMKTVHRAYKHRGGRKQVKYLERHRTARRRAARRAR